jgi:hypothetical protein
MGRRRMGRPPVQMARSEGLGGWSWGDFMAAARLEEKPRAYQLRPVYFRRDQFESAADCLTAAYSQKLPLDLCR